MKMKQLRPMALVLAAALCVGALAACGSSDNGASSPDPTTSGSGTSADSSPSPDGTEEAGYTAGMVLSAADGEITLQLYTPLDETAQAVTDPAAFTPEDYTLTQGTESLTITDESVLRALSGGEAISAALADIRPGSILLVQRDAADGTPTDVVIQNYDDAWEDRPAQITDAGDGSLTVTWYQPGEDAQALTSYIGLDVSGYTLESASESLTVEADTPVYQIQDGLLVESSLDGLTDANAILSLSSDGQLLQVILCEETAGATGGTDPAGADGSTAAE